jgi:hypothetical protein
VSGLLKGRAPDFFSALPISLLPSVLEPLLKVFNVKKIIGGIHNENEKEKKVEW